MKFVPDDAAAARWLGMKVADLRTYMKGAPEGGKGVGLTHPVNGRSATFFGPHPGPEGFLGDNWWFLKEKDEEQFVPDGWLSLKEKTEST